MQREGAELGQFERVEDPLCSVCGGIFLGIQEAAETAVRQVKRYQFENFSVGMTLPTGIQEKEDELRSTLKLKGKETVKTHTARLFGEIVSLKLRKPIERLRPDLTFLVNMSNRSVGISARPLIFYGRYSKPKGVFQRREACPHCSGSGCKKCRNTGFKRRPSVEAYIRKKLDAFTGAERIIFTWIGSEDSQSRVFPPGRPFVVELKNPVKRTVPKRFVHRFRGGQVAVSGGRILPAKPTGLPRFRFKTEAFCRAQSYFDDGLLSELKKSFRMVPVRFDRPHNRPTTKMVYSAIASRKGKNLVVEAVLEGGLPVKRFVSGELVSPSVSEVLKTEVRCRTFDICEVRETGKFSYAEIARI